MRPCRAARAARSRLKGGVWLRKWKNPRSLGPPARSNPPRRRAQFTMEVLFEKSKKVLRARRAAVRANHNAPARPAPPRGMRKTWACRAGTLAGRAGTYVANKKTKKIAVSKKYKKYKKIKSALLGPWSLLPSVQMSYSPIECRGTLSVVERRTANFEHREF